MVKKLDDITIESISLKAPMSGCPVLEDNANT